MNEPRTSLEPPARSPGNLPDDLFVAGLDHAPDTVLISGPGGGIHYANPAASDLLGYSPETLLTLSLPALQPGFPWNAFLPSAQETTLRARNGRIIPVEITQACVTREGVPWRFLFIRDITAHKAAAAAVRKSEARFALAFNASPDAINLTRLSDGVYIEVSNGFENLTGWKREEVLGRNSEHLKIWADPGGRAKMVALLKEKGEFDTAFFNFCRKDGSVIKGMMSGRLISREGVPCLLTITRDITLQMDAQQALGNLTDLISTITAQVPADISLLDGEGRILFLNRTEPGRELQDVIGMDFRDGMADEVRPQATEAMLSILAGSGRETYEGRLGWGPEAEMSWYRCIMGPMTTDGAVTGVVLIAMDETDRRNQEKHLQDMKEALIQSQKLESLGVLAGGVAHDFNNLLTAVMGNLNLAQLKLPETSPAHSHLAAVENIILKASELTRQMLAYSGKGRFVVKPQDLNEVVSEMVHLLKVTVHPKVALEVRLGEDLPAVEGDAAQIQQVVMNLVTNASDALQDGDGAIRVSTSKETLSAERIEDDFPAQVMDPGAFVVLEVEDSGAGMSQEVLARIFEPFYTTKIKGRGLGLSAMLGILKGHRAGIRIRSQVGEGTLFQIYFPASLKPLPPRPEVPGEPAGEYTGNVLLVDDETIILDSIGPALESMGFKVIRAHDGVEALELFEASDLVLVIMDVTMPRMDGATASRRMQALRPSIPVILSSGYDRQALDGARPAAFMQKPYQLKDLRKVVQEVLGFKG